jgi:hypothetical protein
VELTSERGHLRSSSESRRERRSREAQGTVAPLDGHTKSRGAKDMTRSSCVVFVVNWIQESQQFSRSRYFKGHMTSFSKLELATSATQDATITRVTGIKGCPSNDPQLSVIWRTPHLTRPRVPVFAKLDYSRHSEHSSVCDIGHLRERMDLRGTRSDRNTFNRHVCVRR